VRPSSYMVNRFQKSGCLSNRRVWISKAEKGSLSAWRPSFQKDRPSTTCNNRRLRSVCARSVRDVAQRNRARRENYFFAKIKNQKLENQKAKKSKKVKSKTLRQILSFGKRIAEAKTPQLLIRLEPSRSPVQPVTELPGSWGTSDVPRYISPLMRPPYMKRLSPSLPDGPTILLL
jgi:hypothetical protein